MGPAGRSASGSLNPVTVSVIIPVHNAAPWLQETIDSVLAQSWPDIEVIVVDDGSSDGSLEIAHSNGSGRLRVISQRNRGAAAARNTGLAAAQGDFIQFLDADDLLAPRKIQVQVERLLQEENGCIASGAWAMFDGTTEGVGIFPETLWRDMSPEECTRGLFTREGMMPLHAWLFPRSVIEQAGPWNEQLTLNDDREFSTRMVLASRRVLFCGDAVCYYRMTGEGSLSRSRTRAAWESAWQVAVLNVDHLLALQDDPCTRSACATELAGFAISAYEECPDLAGAALVRIRELGVASYLIPFNGLFGRAARLLGCERALHLRQRLRHVWK